MEKKQIKSGPEIIQEFLAAMEATTSIDSETLSAIRGLWQEKKLKQNKLQQELEKARRARLKDGQAQEG